MIYGMHTKTDGCAQVRDRRIESQPLTGFEAVPGTDSALHPQSDFQSYTRDQSDNYVEPKKFFIRGNAKYVLK